MPDDDADDDQDTYVNPDPPTNNGYDPDNYNIYYGQPNQIYNDVFGLDNGVYVYITKQPNKPIIINKDIYDYAYFDDLIGSKGFITDRTNRYDNPHDRRIGDVFLGEEELGKSNNKDDTILLDTVAEYIDSNLDELISAFDAVATTSIFISMVSYVGATLALTTPFTAALAIPVATLGSVMGFTGMVSGIFETGLATFKYISGATKTGLDGKRLSEEEAEHRTSTAGRDINRGVVNTLTSVALFYGSLLLLGLAKDTVNNMYQKPITSEIDNNNSEDAGKTGIIHQHHQLPQQFKKQFDKVGLDIENYKIPLDKADHILKPDGLHTGKNSWNIQWGNFFKDYPNATKPEILEQLSKMQETFGLK